MEFDYCYLKIEHMEKNDSPIPNEAAEIKKELHRFAYAVSHDLQAPLRIVNGYIKIIQRQLLDSEDENLKEYIGLAVDGVKQMEDYLKDLLAYSRVIHSEMNPKTIKVVNSIELVKYGLRKEIEVTNAEIIIGNIPEVITGSKDLIKQLFYHLIDNAIKFHKKGTIPQIQISGEENDLGWSFEIKDNGIGVPQNSHERIFELFQQLHPSDKYGGNGMGLAICKKIVDIHGGKISMESTEGEGSLFKFRIAK